MKCGVLPLLVRVFIDEGVGKTCEMLQWIVFRKSQTFVVVIAVDAFSTLFSM